MAIYPVDHFWLPKMVPKQVLVAKFGLARTTVGKGGSFLGNQRWPRGTIFGSQNWPGGVLLGWKNSCVTGLEGYCTMYVAQFRFLPSPPHAQTYVQ